MRVRRTIGLVSVLALLLVGTALTSTASAAHVDCGDVITTNTTLDSDVGPCNEGDGLVIAADGITLNLNGHRVFADAPLPRFICLNPPACTEGISEDVVGILLDDVSNVTVKNGTVHGFSAGVVAEFGGNNLITGLTTRDNQGPCIGEDFTTQAVGGYGDGIVVFSSPGNRIIGNQVLRNGPFSGIAIVNNTRLINIPIPPFSNNNVVQGNNVDNNRNCFANIGIRVEGPGASNNFVRANRVSRSFQEGISVQPVNNIDFSGLFANPPTCQNRGFPSPNLPQCPPKTGANVTPTNDNNVIASNNVRNNGFGGPQNPPRGITQPNSSQAAAGLNLLVFCPPDARNGRGSIIQGNQITGNAGDGLQVGGCPPQGPANPGGTIGWTNNTIVGNLSFRNNGAGCGILPGNPSCGSRPTTVRVDLVDTSNAITCPSTSGATQAICATFGFAAPPGAPTPFLGTRVLLPGGAVPGPCDANVWRGNAYGTAWPACTTVGGTDIDGPPSVVTGPGPVATASSAAAKSAREGTSSPANVTSLRGKKNR